MTDILTPHARIAIGNALMETGHWSGTRRGVRLSMTLENLLQGRVIVCDIKRGRKSEQVTGETVFEIAETLRQKLRGKVYGR